MEIKVPSAAVLSIADNLVDGQTVLSSEYESSRQFRESVRDNQFETVLAELFDF